jgi:hypothetical protein
MALALLPADPLASPASTEPLPNDAETLMSAVQALAAKGYRYWDTDEDSKAGKVLSALAGVRGCYPEIDALYVKVGSGNQSAQEQAPATSRSAAHKDSNNSSPLSPSAAVSPEPQTMDRRAFEAGFVAARERESLFSADGPWYPKYRTAADALADLPSPPSGAEE